MVLSKAVRTLLILALIALFIPMAVAQADHGLAGSSVIRDSVASPGLAEGNLSDSIIVQMSGVPLPAAGTVYEGLLVSDDGSDKLSLGIFEVSADGIVHHTFGPPDPPPAPPGGVPSPVVPGENLFAKYDKFVVTIEPVPDPDSGPSSVIMGSDSTPTGAMVHIRQLIYSWKGNPAYTDGLHEGTEKGIVVGLRQQTFDALKHAKFSLSAAREGGLSDAQAHAGHTVNIIEGLDGPNYDASWGYGGDQFGVLNYAADVKHATFAMSAASDDATVNKYGPGVVDSGANVDAWASLARDQALRATRTSSVLVAELYMSNVELFLTRALNGYDADGDGSIEPITGEGGADQAYWAAQNMGSYVPVPPEVDAAAPKVGDPYVPMAALAFLVLGVMLLIGGTYVYRRSRARA